MAIGTIFDVKEFSLSDGPGIRTTVFFKGCPLRCVWCHNPEGLSPVREVYRATGGCRACGRCLSPCAHPECQGLGRCLHACPCGLVRLAGERIDSEVLAERLLRGRDLFGEDGGITLSGGEPLMQAEFACALLTSLGNVHKAIETSGYAETELFLDVARRTDLVMMDLKLFDDEAHRRYTGVSNFRILQNAAALRKSGIPHVFRIPLIPGITDTHDNLAALAEVAGDSSVELLSYNTLAPAKYAGVGRTYPDFIDPGAAATPDLSLFRNAMLRR